MKKQLLLILMTLLPMVAWADAVEIDGIYYNLVTKGKIAEVTSNPQKYTGSLVIPEKVSHEGVEYSVTSIGNSAFGYCSGLTSVTIPNSVTEIGSEAFQSCSGLTSITIPHGVITIGGGAFRRCSGLKSVVIPNSVTNIGGYAFEYCSGLTSVTIGNNVKSIDYAAFRYCNGLISVYISDLEAWCKITFGLYANPLGCANHLYIDDEEVKHLVIPNSVISIGEYAFYGCSGLTSVKIPNSVTSIGEGAFAYCNGLTAVYITDLEAWCKINFESNPLFYANYLYLNGVEVKDLFIPNSVTSINKYAFLGCSGLKSVTIPNSVTYIGGEAFRECSSLTSLTIPNSVKSIGSSAFYGCSGMTTVTIGNGISTIGSQAFASCKELTDVYCQAENVPSTNRDAFQGSYTEYATLHVPAASVNAYRQADPWKNFKEVVSLSGDTPEPPVTPKCATPSISYGGKKLTFGCATEGVEYVYTIKDADVKTGYDSEVSLSATYEISVYATKTGYENSDVATATLVWNTATFTETTAPTAVRELTNSHDAPLLIQSNNGVITIQGADEGTQVYVYGINGTQAGSAISQNGQAVVATNLQTGSVAIVKVGEKSVKVVVK